MKLWNCKETLMERYRDPDEIRDREVEELREALEDGNPVDVFLSALFKDEEGFMLVGKYGESGIDVLIEDVDWFTKIPTEPVKVSEKNPAKVGPREWIKQHATGSIGGVFPVILVEEDTESSEPCFYGSRLIAMEEDRRETFFSGRKPEIDDHIMARVMNASKASVTVEAAGVECDIPRSEMSWIYKANCKEAFLAGTVLEAVVMKCDIHPNETGEDGEVDLELSVKRAKPFYDASWKYEVGDRVLATVVSHTSWGLILDINGETTVSVDLSKRFARPLQGQKVVVEITKINEDEDGMRRLHGSIKSRSALSQTTVSVHEEKTLRVKAEKSYLEWLNQNRCVPIDVAREYLISYYQNNFKGEPDAEKIEEWNWAADRILTSLKIYGIRDEGDGCHHAPREVMTIPNDPTPDRLLKLSELFQIFLKRTKGTRQFALPAKMDEVEILTILEEDGTIKSVAAAPAPTAESDEIQNWIHCVSGDVFGDLEDLSPEDDPFFWRKRRSIKSARGLEQVILAEDFSLVERLRGYPGGQELLESSEIWIHPILPSLEGLSEPWERIKFSTMEEGLPKVS